MRWLTFLLQSLMRLRKGGEAHHAWECEYVFPYHYNKVLEQKRRDVSNSKDIRSAELHSFVDSLYIFRVTGDKTDGDWFYMWDFLKELLPSLNILNIRMCTDESKLYSLIEKEYQVDYSSCIDEFDNLVCLYRLVKRGKTVRSKEVQGLVFSMHKCSIEIMKVIWGEDADKQLISLF